MSRTFARVLLCLLICVMVTALAGCASSSSSSSKKTVSSYGLAKTHPDNVAARRITMIHPHSGEKVDAVYFHDGHYDQTVMRNINRLFRDRRANVVGAIDPELIDYLVDIRTRLGLPDNVPFQILNGYRTEETNRIFASTNANVAKESYHLHGWAVDFRIDGVDGRVLCEIAKTMQRGGVAYYPRDNHVHVDLGNIRTWKQK